MIPDPQTIDEAVMMLDIALDYLVNSQNDDVAGSWMDKVDDIRELTNDIITLEEFASWFD
jgi:hypothetical protein